MLSSSKPKSKRSSRKKKKKKKVVSDSDSGDDTDLLLEDLSDSETDSDLDIDVDDSSNDSEENLISILEKERSAFRSRKVKRFKEQQKKKPRKKRKKPPKRNTIFQPEDQVQGRIGELSSKLKSLERGEKPSDFNKMFNPSFPAFDSMSGGRFRQQKAFLSKSKKKKDKQLASNRVVRQMDEMEDRADKAVRVLSKNNNKGFKRLIRRSRKKDTPPEFRKKVKQQLTMLRNNEIEDLDEDMLGQAMLDETVFEVPDDIVSLVRKNKKRRRFEVEGLGMDSEQIQNMKDEIGFKRKKRKLNSDELDLDFDPNEE